MYSERQFLRTLGIWGLSNFNFQLNFPVIFHSLHYEAYFHKLFSRDILFNIAT